MTHAIADPRYSDRLKQAINVGMVEVNDFDRAAKILAPPNPDILTDSDWLAILSTASALLKELESLGYKVSV